LVQLGDDLAETFSYFGRAMIDLNPDGRRLGRVARSFADYETIATTNRALFRNEREAEDRLGSQGFTLFPVSASRRATEPRAMRRAFSSLIRVSLEGAGSRWMAPHAGQG
jgi:hypothetical protein